MYSCSVIGAKWTIFALAAALAAGGAGFPEQVFAACALSSPNVTCTSDGNSTTTDTGYTYIGSSSGLGALSISGTAADMYTVNSPQSPTFSTAALEHWFIFNMHGSGNTLNIGSYTSLTTSVPVLSAAANYGAPVTFVTLEGSGTANISADAIINTLTGPAINLRGHEVTLNLSPSASGANNGASIYSIAGETISFIPYSGVPTAGLLSNNPANVFLGSQVLDASSPSTIGNFRIGRGELTVNNGIELGGNIDLVLKVHEPTTPVQSGALGIPADPDPQRIGTTIFNNNRTVTGYFQLGSGDDQFNNNAGATYFLRDFADTDQNLVRDTKSVGIADFGAGNDTFNNLAGSTLTLAPVVNAAVVNPSGYYLPTTGLDNRPLEANFFDLTREGVVQGHLTNLQTFNNVGVIDLRGSAVGNTLVITGNATSGGTPGTGVFVSNGGELLVNTVLNDGIPLSGQINSYSDMLIVDSTQLGTGATVITVHNIGGLGALTSGNGIEIVEVRNKSASATGVFSLKGDYVTVGGGQAIVAGAYSYALFHNGVGADTEDGNWYLRSSFSPSTSLYEAYPQALLALNGLPTLQQRVGNRYWREATPHEPQTVFCKDPAQNFKCAVTDEQAGYYEDNGSRSVIEGNGIWGRIEGAHGRFEPAVTTSGTDYDYNLFKLQAGLDGLLSESESGKLIGGITVHYGSVNTDVRSFYGTGSIDTQGYGLGANLTWYGTNGFYVDAQGQATWYDSDLYSDTLRQAMANDNNGFGYALSLETGKRIDLSDGWAVTPQAQLVYSSIDFKSFSDPFGARVSLDDGDSLRGRLGLAVERQAMWKDEDGEMRRLNVYGIANLYNEFLDGTQVDVSGAKFESRNDRLWGGIGIGGSYNWADDKYSIYGEVAANTSLKNFADSYTVSGTVGFRVKW